jgi:hypothetical protein
MERQLTFAPHGHILTNTGVWSPDGQWIVYDVRSDPAGSVFDGTRIERVHVETGEVQVLYESRNGACCGVVTCNPLDSRVVFILGPEHPTPDWQYGPSRRQGALLDTSRPEDGVVPLEARDLVPPFTRGALRGGTHLHTFAPNGRAVLFTYDDEVDGPNSRRTVGVCLPGEAVTVPRTHPRNHDGTHYALLLARTDGEIVRASEESWLGDRAVVFQGQLPEGHRELYLVFLLDTTLRRLTYTRGLSSLRHWPRPSPDLSRIAFLMEDDFGLTQLWTVTPRGKMRQLTRNVASISSAFTWGAPGIAHVLDGSVCITDADTGETRRLTQPSDPPPRPEACVLSPDGRSVAFVRPADGFNQIFVVDVD